MERHYVESIEHIRKSRQIKAGRFLEIIRGVADRTDSTLVEVVATIDANAAAGDGSPTWQSMSEALDVRPPTESTMLLIRSGAAAIDRERSSTDDPFLGLERP